METIKTTSRTNRKGFSQRTGPYFRKGTKSCQQVRKQHRAQKDNTIRSNRSTVLKARLDDLSLVEIIEHEYQDLTSKLVEVLYKILQDEKDVQSKRWNPNVKANSVLLYLLKALKKLDKNTYFFFSIDQLQPKLYSHVSYSVFDFIAISPDCDILYYTCRYNRSLHEILLVLFSILHHLKGINLWDEEEQWATEWLSEKLYNAESEELETDDIQRISFCIKHYNNSALYHASEIKRTTYSIPYLAMLLRQYKPRLAECIQIKKTIQQGIYLLQSPHNLLHFLDAIPDDDNDDDIGPLVGPKEIFKLYWDTSDDIACEVQEWLTCQANQIGWNDLAYQSTFSNPSDLKQDYSPDWPYEMAGFFNKLQTQFKALKQYYNV